MKIEYYSFLSLCLRSFVCIHNSMHTPQNYMLVKNSELPTCCNSKTPSSGRSNQQGICSINTSHMCTCPLQEGIDTNPYYAGHVNVSHRDLILLDRKLREKVQRVCIHVPTHSAPKKILLIFNRELFNKVLAIISMLLYLQVLFYVFYALTLYVCDLCINVMCSYVPTSP